MKKVGKVVEGGDMLLFPQQGIEGKQLRKVCAAVLKTTLSQSLPDHTPGLAHIQLTGKGVIPDQAHRAELGRRL